MEPVGNNLIGRKKVIWGFGKLLPHIKRTIDTSRFIATDEKDGLYSTIEKAYQQLTDALNREFGDIPITPSQEKKWKDTINKKRKSQGKPPIVEAGKVKNPILDELVKEILNLKPHRENK